MFKCNGVGCMDMGKCKEYEYCMFRDVGKKSCWCGICDYMLACPENYCHEKCNLNSAFRESNGEKDLKCEKPCYPCKICSHASWVEISGVYFFSCRSTSCPFLDGDLPFR